MGQRFKDYMEESPVDFKPTELELAAIKQWGELPLWMKLQQHRRIHDYLSKRVKDLHKPSPLTAVTAPSENPFPIEELKARLKELNLNNKK